ncbi:MAG: Hsp70 family protein [Rhodospirillales bacterium]|nr:Hsp70 family protein [Rhodospirillales bacterium]
MRAVIGVDFGTTNSVAAILGPDGAVSTARFAAGDVVEEVFRSVLCFWTEQASGALRHEAGPAAVAAYLDDPLDTRLIMSPKTYLAQRSFTETRIYGRPFTLERLIALFLAELAQRAGLPLAGASIVAGRPVRFAGGHPDETLALARLRAAYGEAGFGDVTFALEPEGAGYRFARTLDRAATVLIGDFGGGTSDFSVLRFEPGAGMTALGHAGIGIAGDHFDYRIIDRVICPLLGKGDEYTIMGKRLPVPPEYFSSFARWHLLSLMRAPRTLRAIAEVARASEHPQRLEALIALIEDEMGFHLYQSVAALKAALSRAPEAVLRFAHGRFVIEQRVTRADFESWIAPDLARLDATIERALAEAGHPAIDHVFLTGGTSFVPAVRALFAARFGAATLRAGGEFVSVAEGLALIGRDRLGRAA